MILHVDFETQSNCDLAKKNSSVYSKDENTRVLCMAWAFEEDTEVKLFTPQMPLSSIQPVIDHVLGGGIVCAHNAAFEFDIWNNCFYKLGLPKLKPEQLKCTMSKAMAMSLPGSLDKLAAILSLSNQKINGTKLINKLSKNINATPEKFPNEFEELYLYCKQDVRVEMELDKALRDLAGKEQRLWVLDRVINLRGIGVDVTAASKLSNIIVAQTEKLASTMREATSGKVKSGNAGVALVKYLKDEGIDLDSVSKSSITKLLKSNIPEEIKDILRIRQESAKSSTAKIKMILDTAESDNRIRNTIQFHSASTGRFGGRGFQVQNLPRPTIDNELIDTFFSMIDNQKSESEITAMMDMFTPSPLTAISSMIRGLIKAGDGNKLMVCDYASIEARIVAWVSGEEKILEVFRTHGKIYELAASGIYNVDIDKVTKDQRMIGKVACIAEGQLVLTDKGLIAIEDVKLDHKLWDGLEWVSHEGVVYMGEKDVFEYQGLTATGDHRVFISEKYTIPFGECASKQRSILQTGIDGKEIRLDRNNIPYSFLGRRQTRQKRTHASARTCTGDMLWLLRYKTSFLSKHSVRQNKRLPGVLQAETNSKMVRPEMHGHEKSMHSSEYQVLQRLRRTRNKIQFQFSTGSLSLDSGKPWLKQRIGNRPNRQQWKLRTWKLEIFNSISANQKHKAKQEHRRTIYMGKNTKPVVSFYNRKLFSRWKKYRRNYFNCKTSSEREKKKLERHTGKTFVSRVYDIVNCGPRNRFTVSNVLVHNCLALGFGGGVGAFKNMASGYGLEIEDDKAKDIVYKWRAANKNIVKYWKTLQSAALAAMSAPETSTKAGLISYYFCGTHLWCCLPSKRFLCYPFAKAEKFTVLTKNKIELEYDISYMTQNSLTKKFERAGIYHGILCENVCQAIARDVLACALMSLEAHGHSVVAHVHDEIICEVKKDFSSIEEMARIMCDLPEWANGLPIAAEGFETIRYRK